MNAKIAISLGCALVAVACMAEMEYATLSLIHI